MGAASEPSSKPKIRVDVAGGTSVGRYPASEPIGDQFDRIGWGGAVGSQRASHSSRRILDVDHQEGFLISGVLGK